MDTTKLRRRARVANADVEHVLDKIERKYGRRHALPDADDPLLFELRDARHDAGYWNELLNNERGWV